METYIATPSEEHAHFVSYVASDVVKPEATKTRGRKPGNKANAQKKKPPQRGMGVAQLERLRLQERLTEMPPLDSQSIHNNFPYQRTNHLSLPERIPSVPVMHGAGNYGVPTIAGVGALGLDQGLVGHKVGHGGGFGAVCGGSGSGQVLLNHNRNGVDPELKVGQVGSSSLMTLDGTSRELSSMPNMQQPSAVMPHERCDICFKKKRFDVENIGFHDVKDKYAQTTSINNGYGIPGMINHENDLHFNGGINSFGAKAARSAFYAGHPNVTNEGVQAVVIHRNGNSMGRHVPREYEFFPRKVGRSTSSKDLEFPAEASVAVCGEASCFTTTAYDANAASNSVDLSLKLSL